MGGNNPAGLTCSSFNLICPALRKRFSWCGGRILKFSLISNKGWAGYPADYRISGRITGFCGKKQNFITKFWIILQLGSVRISLDLQTSYVCLYGCPSIFIMQELLLTYCYSIMNFRHYALICLFEGFIRPDNSNIPYTTRYWNWPYIWPNPRWNIFLFGYLQSIN